MKNQKENSIPELTPDMIGSRAVARENSLRGKETVMIELDKIVILEAFNARDEKEYGDIKGLAKSILENGQTFPGYVDVLADGRFVLTDGHRRFAALNLLKDQGFDPKFEAFINAKKMTEEERIIQMFTSQDNEKLSMYAITKLIDRMVKLGHTKDSVAKKLGKAPSFISYAIGFQSEPQEIKNAVLDGTMTVSEAMKLKKAVPDVKERVAAAKSGVKSVNKTKENKARKILASICELYEVDEEAVLKAILKAL